MSLRKNKISISQFCQKGFLGLFLKITSPLIDHILGIHKLNAIYQLVSDGVRDRDSFLQKLIDVLDVNYSISGIDLKKIPESGPLIIVSNHPYGGIEGILLAHILNGIRSDVKIMANSALKVFPELSDFFIFTNPLVSHNPKNVKSINECRKHLEKKGLLLFFPAGKVAYYRKEKKRVCDGDWNRIAAHLAITLNVPVLPIFISGHNSKLFLFLGRIHYRLKLLMLPREFVKGDKRQIHLYCSNPIASSYLKKIGNSRDITEFLRISSYILDPFSGSDENTVLKKIIDLPEMPAIIDSTDKNTLKKEISLLPEKQHLFDYRNFSVYYGYFDQLKNVVRDITRLREITFRELDEGSGHPADTDIYDSTYTHLFIWDTNQDEIIGAYRMGQTDKIGERYLSHMYDFNKEFLSATNPALEMGRSFIIRKHQQSIYGLFLLWRGIGEFLVRNPQYRKLYGTVSLSHIYNDRSISLIDTVLTPPYSPVKPVLPLRRIVHKEIEEYLQTHTLDYKGLSILVKSSEEDGKDLPILLKQYWKMKAEFIVTGVDKSFLETPGLLLLVHMPGAPESSLKMYLEEGLTSYLEYKESPVAVEA